MIPAPTPSLAERILILAAHERIHNQACDRLNEAQRAIPHEANGTVVLLQDGTGVRVYWDESGEIATEPVAVVRP